MAGCRMTDWEECYQTGNTGWDRGAVSPALAEEVAGRPLAGRVLVPGCGAGHDVAWLAEQGFDVLGLDLAPTAIAKAKANYPVHADRFVVGDLFDLAEEHHAAYDVVVEHTCLSGMPPELRSSYQAGVAAALKSGGCIVGVWFIDPELDPGHEGPPYPLPIHPLDELFGEGFVVEVDYVSTAAFPGREGRERVRVLRKF